MKGLCIVDGGQAFALGFSLLNTRSPKLLLQPLHQADSHLILGACRGVMDFGRSTKTISLSKTREWENVCFVSESNHRTGIRFLS